MDMSLFTSFAGRIGRQQWWLGTIALIIISLILYFVLLPILGISIMMGGVDPAMMRKLAMAQVVLVIIFAYPVSALMKKRLNDRDRPAWYMYLYWAPTVIGLILSITGVGYTMADINGVMIPMPTTLSWLVNLASLIIGIWALVELGFLRGTEGPNQHGPDPLAG